MQISQGMLRGQEGARGGELVVDMHTAKISHPQNSTRSVRVCLRKNERVCNPVLNFGTASPPTAHSLVLSSSGTN